MIKLLVIAASLAASGSASGGFGPSIKAKDLSNDLLRLAYEDLERSNDGEYVRKMVRLADVRTQVVTGKLYKLTMIMAQTDCKRSGAPDFKKASKCNQKDSAETEVCVVDIWERVWMNRTEVVRRSCSGGSGGRTKRDVVPLGFGGVNRSKHRETMRDEVVELMKEFPSLLSQKESRKQLRELRSHKSFKSFMKVHNKEYDSVEEYHRRYRIFRSNMKKVQFLRETELGSGRYGASPFADLAEGEFRKQKLGWKKSPGDVPDWPEADIPDVELPESFDWRDQGAVTPVKNQGSCGSCWAFSVTGNVEGQWKLKQGKLISLSEQELVDCDKYDHGCEGGLPSNAYEAIMEIGGLELEKDYAYDGDDETCQFDDSKAKASVSGGLTISTNETQMAQWLLKNGPISIGLNANAMQFYMGGVSHPWKFLCSPKSLDHGVLIVGFGITRNAYFHKELPFWIVKNSWGTGWGEKGYYRVYRGDGTCGLNMMATTATVN